MEIKEGQTWVLKKIPNRPNIEIVRVDKYSDSVFWCYVGQSTRFESKTSAFLADFIPKAG